MGAWIEIQLKEEVEQTRWVAPLVGAWIEISSICCEVTGEILSLPSWERGLKYEYAHIVNGDYGRSPRGSVD